MSDETNDKLAVQEIVARTIPRNYHDQHGAIPRLETLADIKRHMAKIYRDGKNGKLKSSTVTACVFALNSAAKLLKDMEGESRMKKVEEQLAKLMTAKQNAPTVAPTPAPVAEPVPKKNEG